MRRSRSIPSVAGPAGSRAVFALRPFRAESHGVRDLRGASSPPESEVRMVSEQGIEP
jgi:hypothetical protein